MYNEILIYVLVLLVGVGNLMFGLMSLWDRKSTSITNVEKFAPKRRKRRERNTEKG